MVQVIHVPHELEVPAYKHFASLILYNIEIHEFSVCVFFFIIIIICHFEVF